MATTEAAAPLLGDALRRRRLASGWTPVALRRATGIHPTTLAAWEEEGRRRRVDPGLHGRLLATLERTPPPPRPRVAPAPLGVQLKALLRERGLRQEDLLARAGLSASELWSFMVGERVPHAEKRRRLAEALDVPADALAGPPPPDRRPATSLQDYLLADGPADAPADAPAVFLLTRDDGRRYRVTVRPLPDPSGEGDAP